MTSRPGGPINSPSGTLNSTSSPAAGPQHSGEETGGVSARFWLAFACPLLVMVHQGVWGGFTSPVLAANCGGETDQSSSGSAAGRIDAACPHCMNCELDLSDQLQSIFVAAPSLASIPVALLGGACTDYCGRRATILIGGLMSLAGWTLMFFTPFPDPADILKLHDARLIPQLETPTWLILFAGRLMAMIGSTLQVIACSVWVSESTPSSIRGGVMTCISFGWCGGTLTVFALGNVLMWRELCIAGGAIALITIFLVIGLIESPRWLAANHGMDAAERALRALRPEGARLEGTLAEIAQALAVDHQNRAARQPFQSREPLLSSGVDAPRRSSLQIIPVVIACSNQYLNAFPSMLTLRRQYCLPKQVIATILMSSVPLSGVLVISNFAGEIFSNIFPAHRNLATVMLPIAAGVGVAAVSVGADRFGRKPMLLFSCGGMSLSMMTMTGYYWCFASSDWVFIGKQSWEWASFVAMTLYMFFNQAGLGPLAAVVTTEIVDSSVRGLAMGVATMGAGLVGAGTNYITLPIVDSIGYDWMFAGCALALTAGCT